MFWEISINRNYGLNMKCPPQACVSEHSVPNWWRYFERFWNLWKCGLTSRLPTWDGPFSWYPLLEFWQSLSLGFLTWQGVCHGQSTQATTPSPPWYIEPEGILSPSSVAVREYATVIRKSTATCSKVPIPFSISSALATKSLKVLRFMYFKWFIILLAFLCLCLRYASAFISRLLFSPLMLLTYLDMALTLLFLTVWLPAFCCVVPCGSMTMTWGTSI